MLREARMSALYYEHKLWWANLWNFYFEMTIAIGATSSGVAAWALWKEGIGVIAWAIITGASTTVSILKPILSPTKTIESCTRQHQGWHSLYFALDKLLLFVRTEGVLSKENARIFFTLFDQMV